MSFQLHHHLTARSFRPVLTKAGGESFFKVNEKGDFRVLFPGQFKRRISAVYTELTIPDPNIT